MAQSRSGSITLIDVTDIGQIENWYLATSASSGVTRSTPGWTTAIQAMTATNEYLWSYQVTKGSNNVVINTTEPIIIGHYGHDGQNGQPGANGHSPVVTATRETGSNITKIFVDGVEIASIEDGDDGHSPIVTTSKTGSTTHIYIDGVESATVNDGTSVSISSATKSDGVTTIVLTDGSGNTTLTINDGEDGEDGQPGAPGTNSYLHIAWANDTNGTDFSTTVSTNKLYIGTYSDSNVADSSNYADYNWTRIKGETGATGPQGNSITNTTTYYYLQPSDGAAPTSSTTGTTTIPNFVDGGTYYRRVVTTLSNGESIDTGWFVDGALTTENQNAYDAWVDAGLAEQRTSKIINNSNGVTVVAGISGTNVDPSDSSTYGYNTIMAPNYLGLRYNTINLTKLTTLGLELYIPTLNGSNQPIQGQKGIELTSSAIKFYKPGDTTTPQLIIGANGTLQSGNYTRGNDTKFASSGTKIDLTNGEIYTPYFRLAQGLDGVTAGAYVHGTIEALDGRIGTGYKPIGEPETNYWEIGDYTDYNLENTAKIIGHGSSFIQLGDDGTWRLATNRIHTGWHESGDTFLHFLEYTDGNNTLFWDYGLHTPESKDDKFIYIRTAANTTALSNLLYDIDDDFTAHYWNYKFWIDGEGNIYAPEIYKKKNDVWTPVDAGGSVDSSTKLSSYGGAYNQPVYFPNTGDNQGKPVGITDGNGNAITIGVSVPANAKFTDTKNTAGATSSNSKLFLIGATEQTDNPQTYSRSTVYIGTDGLLYSGSKKVAVVDDISAVLKYKGTKATITNLPSSGNTTGDVWHVIANNGEYAWDGTEWQELGSTITIPANTDSSTTGITIADHNTTTIYGVQSTTTTASKVTLGTAFTIPNVTEASDITVPKAASSATACDDITDWQPGSGSANLTFTMDSTDSKKLKITFNHAHTAPTLSYTARSITGVSGSTTASKVTLGTEFTVPNVTDSSNVTVPIKNASNTTVVTNGAHSIADNGHIHTI